MEHLEIHKEQRTYFNPATLHRWKYEGKIQDCYEYAWMQDHLEIGLHVVWIHMHGGDPYSKEEGDVAQQSFIAKDSAEGKTRVYVS
jgi:hypothetical protein